MTEETMPIHEISKKVDDYATKFDTHVDQYNSDIKKFLWWVISTLIGVIAIAGTLYGTIARDQLRIDTLDNNTKNFVSKDQLESTVALFNTKLDNVNYKLDSIKQALGAK